MNKSVIKAVIITLVCLVVFILVGLFVIGYLKPKPAGLLVVSNIQSEVYVDGELQGKTPYEGTFTNNNVSVRIIPENSEGIGPYETEITLTPGLKSVIKREFDKDEEKSSGYNVFFEKVDAKKASIDITTDPESTQVFIDGTPKGFAPYRPNSISQGEHQILIKMADYNDLELSAKTLNGYKLHMIAKLAKIKSSEEVRGESTEVKTYVLILDTPTGYLRVRSEPGSNGSEIHQVKPGEKYLFLEEDSESGWYKIQIQPEAPGLPEGFVGWVSNEYSQKLEEASEPSLSN